MFLPIFISILMGLISPTSSNYNTNSTDIVYLNTVDPKTDDITDTGYNPATDSGDDGTGGETGSNPPR